MILNFLVNVLRVGFDGFNSWTAGFSWFTFCCSALRNEGIGDGTMFFRNPIGFVLKGRLVWTSSFRLILLASSLSFLGVGDGWFFATYKRGLFGFSMGAILGATDGASVGTGK